MPGSRVLRGPRNHAQDMSTATMTFLFTDIASSTEHLVQLGDERWATLLSGYRAMVRDELRRFGGHEVDNAGDGFFAVFPGISSAVSCARAIARSTDALGLPSRTGVHRGACEVGGEKPTGVNVHVAARIMACAQPGEVLVSEAIKSTACVDAGRHHLKGLPGRWRLYRAARKP
jgi:class 3 adenylate cyclase